MQKIPKFISFKGYIMKQKEDIQTAFKNKEWGWIISYLIFILILALCIIWGLKAIYNQAYPDKELYTSTQTIHQNTTEVSFNCLDINGRGCLAPLHVETLEAAWKFGETKGEPNKIYWWRVVVMALDPSIRNAVLPSGETIKPAYRDGSVYTFYIVDGEDIIDEKERENIISIGKTKYKVILLSISGAPNDLAYTFRIEELDS